MIANSPPRRVLETVSFQLDFRDIGTDARLRRALKLQFRGACWNVLVSATSNNDLALELSTVQFHVHVHASERHFETATGARTISAGCFEESAGV